MIPVHEQLREAQDAIGRIRAAVYSLRSLADEPHRACPIANEAHEDLLRLGNIIAHLGDVALGVKES